MDQAEFRATIDRLKQIRDSEMAIEEAQYLQTLDHHATIMEAIQIRYHSAVNVAIEQLHPNAHRKARMYVNGDTTVYQHRKRRRRGAAPLDTPKKDEQILD